MKLLAIVVVVTMLSACSTVAGFGDDIKGAANWTRDQMTGSKSDSNQK
jgi:predicted small secreted protein